MAISDRRRNRNKIHVRFTANPVLPSTLKGKEKAIGRAGGACGALKFCSPQALCDLYVIQFLRRSMKNRTIGILAFGLIAAGFINGGIALAQSAPQAQI